MPECIKNMYKRESVRKGRFPFVCIAKHVALNGVNSNTLCDANACKSNFAEYGL